MRRLWTAFWQLSKSERVGIFVLMLLLGLNLTADWWMVNRTQEPVMLSEELASYLGEEEAGFASTPTQAMAEADLAVEPTLFYFDINTIDSSGLSQLGISARAISGLMRFRNKGGKVRGEDDFDKLYSLSDADKQRLRPWLRIEQGSQEGEVVEQREHAGQMAKTWVRVDLNAADSSTLVQVKGIGPAFATRIIKYRERLGGFLDLSQLGEVYGIDSARFEQLAPFFIVQPAPLIQRSLNTSTEEDLAAHPYIGKRLARQIVAYRTQHGDFKADEELLRIHGLDSARMNKMKPYLQN